MKKFFDVHKLNLTKSREMNIVEDENENIYLIIKDILRVMIGCPSVEYLDKMKVKAHFRIRNFVAKDIYKYSPQTVQIIHTWIDITFDMLKALKTI